MHQDPEQLALWLDDLKRQSIEEALAQLDAALEEFADAGLCCQYFERDAGSASRDQNLAALLQRW